MKQFFSGILLVIGCLVGPMLGAVEWSIKSYPCPSDALFEGFVVEGKGRIYLPDPPTEEPASIQAFIQRSSLVFREYLRELPEGSLVVLDRKRNTLAARSTVEGHVALEGLLGDWNQQLPKMITLQVTLLEIPIADLTALLEETAAQQDHTAQLERLEQAGAKLVASTKLETKSGQRSTTQMVSMLNHVTEFAARADGSTEAATTEQESIGLLVEVDPIVSRDGRIIDLNLSISHTSKAAALRSIPLGTLAGKRIHGGVQDFTTEKWTSATALTPGQSRLLGAAPAEDPTMTRLCFVTAHAPIVIGIKDPRAETWLKTHGDAVEPIPAEEKKTAPKLGILSGMIIKKFNVPPDFLSGGDSTAAAPADPFGPVSASSPEPTFTVRMTAESVLKAQGIAFPEGASATFNRATSVLTVVNLPANMELVEAYVGSITYHTPAVLQIRAHIVEADSALVRKIARSSLSVTDHREAWQTFQAEIAAGRGRVVSVAAIETRSGQRSQVQSGSFYAWATSNLAPQISESKTEKTVTAIAALPVAELRADIERIPLGLQFEIDPVLGADGFTIDLNASIQRQSQPPTEHFAAAEPQTVDAPSVDFHPQVLTTAFTTADKLWRMIGTWQPVGADGKLDPAVMQAIFIQAVVLRVGE